MIVVKWRRRLDGHDLLLLGREEFVDLLDISVVELLHLSFGILGYILGGIVRLDALLDGLIGITASITDADLSGLSIGLDLLDEFTTTVFCQRGDAEADKLPIVFGRDAERRVDDSPLDISDDPLLPWGWIFSNTVR